MSGAKKSIVEILKKSRLARGALFLLVWCKRAVFTFVNRKCYQSRLKEYKFVHLMFNDTFNKPFVDFLTGAEGQTRRASLW